MSNKTIDDFTAVVTPATTDTVIVTQAGITKKETLAQIDTLLSATTKTLTNKTLTSPTFTGTAIAANLTVTGTFGGGMALGFLSGLAMTHAADTEHDITVAVGKARDSTDATDMALASAITKQFDATWAVGTAAGGMSAGEALAFELMTLDVAPATAWVVGNTITGQTSSQTCIIAKVLTTTTYYVISRSGAFTLGEILTNGTTTADQGAANPTFALQVGTLHIWQIKRSDTNVVDVVGSINEISGITPTLPANYDYKRLIGSYRINVTSNIINGDWWGTGLNRTFMYDTPILDVAVVNPGATTALTVSLSVPGGIVVVPKLNLSLYEGSSNWCFLYISSLENADMAGVGTTAPLFTCRAHGVNGAYDGDVLSTVRSNTSSQIRYRVSYAGADTQVHIATLGYEMSL